MVVAAAKVVFNIAYRTCCLVRRRSDVVLFLSRQASEPSYDFEQIAQEFERCGWCTRFHVKKLSKKTVVSYAVHVVKELYFLAGCRIVFLDRYDPVISLLNFRCEDVPLRDIDTSLHSEFPCEPVIVQLWHAFGAFKKFGYQSVGTHEGHSESMITAFSIHRNYSWIVCSGGGCRQAYAEAFLYPADRVVPLNRPEYDELLVLRKTLKDTSSSEVRRRRILFAPTLRKSKQSQHPFRQLCGHADELEKRVDADIIWSFHPLEDGLDAPSNVSELLLDADCVVTDYSSIVYEAFVLGKPFVFYAPDLDAYRLSPGLNTDPGLVASELTFRDEETLAIFLREVLTANSDYPWQVAEGFCAPAFTGCSDRVAKNLVEFTLGKIPGNRNTG